MGCICFHRADALCQSRRDRKIRPNQMNRAMGTRSWQAAFLRYGDRVTSVFVLRNEGIKRFSRELAKQILIAKIALRRVYAFFFLPGLGSCGFCCDRLQKLQNLVSRAVSAAVIG